MAYQGKFNPKNPSKYIGDYTNIVYRSSWELKFMVWCDINPDVLKWGSEEVIIPYSDPSTGRYRRYFPDFIVKLKKRDGSIGVMMIEIKPEYQTREPVKKKKITKRYINEVMTWGTNSAKWEAAHRYCKERNWEFRILTEKDLNIKF